MIDELDGISIIESDFNQRLTKWFALLILSAILFLTILILCTSGCVTAAKNTYHGVMDTPIPTTEPTPEPEPTTPEPTPTPAPTLTDREYMLQTSGYELREWLQWFRPNVEGIGNASGIRPDTGDLRTAVTVWGYKFVPSYHYYSVSWGRPFLVKPEDKNDQFLFIFVNSYSDGDDVRQYGIDYNHFAVQIDDRLYYPDYFEYPEHRITEFDNTQNYAKTSTIQPYGYRIVQDLDTGVYSPIKEEWLMGGRSNAWDGYIQFSIPYNVTPQTHDIKVIGTFANLAPQSWWRIK